MHAVDGVKHSTSLFYAKNVAFAATANAAGGNITPLGPQFDAAPKKTAQTQHCSFHSPFTAHGWWCK
jgi:hypothetical protein